MDLFVNFLGTVFLGVLVASFLAWLGEKKEADLPQSVSEEPAQMASAEQIKQQLLDVGKGKVLHLVERYALPGLSNLPWNTHKIDAVAKFIMNDPGLYSQVSKEGVLSLLKK